MHLDTLITMIDVDTFVGLSVLRSRRLRACGISRPRAGGEPSRSSDAIGLPAALAEVLGRDGVRVLQAEEDARAAAREQWNDADNYLAIAPGVVLGYDRNVVTNTMLRRNGIEVISLAGEELGRGRGGARCMSCPSVANPIGGAA